MQADDLRLLGIPHSRRIIAIFDPHHDASFKGFLPSSGKADPKVTATRLPHQCSARAA